MTPEAVVLKWNVLAKNTGLGRVRILSDTRRTKLARRLREAAELARKEDRTEEDIWTEVMDRIESSSFCRGGCPGTNGHRVFKASFDFLLQAKSFPRILEGCYNEDGDMERFNQRRSERIPPEKRTVDEWRDCFKTDGRYMKKGFLQEHWNRVKHGPAPGEPGCLVPLAILKELGFDIGIRAVG